MGEWVKLSKKAHHRLCEIVDKRINSRSYGRISLLYIHSDRFSHRFRKKHVKYRW
jgi:hypothetical protein